MFAQCKGASNRLLALSCSVAPFTTGFGITLRSLTYSILSGCRSPSSHSLSCPPFSSQHLDIGHSRGTSSLLCSFPQHSFLSACFVPHNFPKASCWLSQFVHPPGSMDLKSVLHILEQLAPLSLAESWDNVGLLVEPSKPRPIKTILMTNDLTTSVMDEAEEMGCDLIISYHPPLFRPMKRLVQKDWKQRLAVRAVENGMAIYSPHTSWDSVRGGVNDWLIGGLGSGQISVLTQALSSAPQRHRMELTVRSPEELNAIMAKLRETDDSGTHKYSMHRSEEGEHCVNVTFPSSALTPIAQMVLGHAAVQSFSLTKLEQPPLPGCGQGRLSILDEPVSVATAVQRMKSHLGLNHLRLALGEQQTLDSTVRTAAVCAGSGASVLQGVKADLYITGEMSHHEVLDAVANGMSVILSDHSNSERGFLAVFKERLAARLQNSVTVAISQRDRDPLTVV